MSTIATLAAEARSALAGSFNGTLTGPDDAGYDEARSVYNAMIDRRPGLVARCTSAADVAAVIGFARSQNALIAVRGGGHNGGGLGVCDDGVVIDLAGINSIDVDAAARTVRVGGGCVWKEVDAATHEAGRRRPCGIIGTTGVGGLTLGGGIGHIARSGGLTIDNLLEAEVVLADGSIVRAVGRREPGAVLGAPRRRRQLRRGHVVHVPDAAGRAWSWPVPPSGRWTTSAAVMRAYREFLPAAPRELNGWFAFVTVPPVPAFPEELHGRKMAAIVWCHTGSEEEAAAAMAPMLEAVEPVLHGGRPDAVPGAERVLRPALPEGRPVVLAGGLRARAAGRRHRAARRVRRTRCPPASRPCTCTRSTGPCTTSARVTPRSATAT